MSSSNATSRDERGKPRRQQQYARAQGRVSDLIHEGCLPDPSRVGGPAAADGPPICATLGRFAHRHPALSGKKPPHRRVLQEPRLRGSEISIEEGDACVACGRRLRRPKRGGKRASSTVTRSPGRSRAFSTPLAGCTGPREFGSRTDIEQCSTSSVTAENALGTSPPRRHARFRTADTQELAKSVESSGRTAWLRNRGTMRPGCP